MEKEKVSQTYINRDVCDVRVCDKCLPTHREEILYKYYEFNSHGTAVSLPHPPSMQFPIGNYKTYR